MVNSFTLESINSRTYDIGIYKRTVYNAPASDVEFVKVPGRNGDIPISKKRYENASIVYSCWIKGDLKTKTRQIKAWLNGSKGYRKLEDTYDADYYRYACFISGLTFDTTGDVAEFDIVFSCKPFRYAVSGDAIITLTVDGAIINGEGFPSRPLLTIYGTGGTVSIGSYSLVISAIDVSVTVDTETQNAYKGTVNKNDTINTADIELASGSNAITLGTGITKVEISPRWCTL